MPILGHAAHIASMSDWADCPRLPRRVGGLDAKGDRFVLCRTARRMLGDALRFNPLNLGLDAKADRLADPSTILDLAWSGGWSAAAVALDRTITESGGLAVGREHGDGGSGQRRCTAANSDHSRSQRTLASMLVVLGIHKTGSLVGSRRPHRVLLVDRHRMLTSSRASYSHVVPTLVRRAFEASAVAVHFTQTAAGRRAIAAYQASKTRLHPPVIGRAMVAVFDAMRALTGDGDAAKLFYKSLSDDAHTAPGVMIQSHFESLETGRFGPQPASADPISFAKAADAIEIGCGMVHTCVRFAFPKLSSPVPCDRAPPPAYATSLPRASAPRGIAHDRTVDCRRATTRPRRMAMHRVP